MPPNSSRDQPERRSTIRDVAQAAGVSKSLASLVFVAPDRVGQERRRLVLDAAERLGYRRNQAARSLASQHGGFIGVLVADPHNPVLADIADSVRATLAERGEVALSTAAIAPVGDGDPALDRAVLEVFGDLRPSALIVVGSAPAIELLPRLVPGRPVVLVSAMAPQITDARIVRGDDTTGVRLLIEHLITLGHQDIAHIGGVGGAVAELRAAAYREAMSAAGLGERARIALSDFTEPSGRSAAAELFAGRDVPTAILAVNDLAGVGALAAAHAASRPTAVTGYDGSFVAAFEQIDLTTIEIDRGELAEHAARLLHEPGGTEVLIAPRLVVRGSTLRP